MKLEQKIVDYTILGSQTAVDLKKEVIKYLNNGWVPLGGVSVLPREYDQDRYFQSMVKYNIIKRI